LINQGGRMEIKELFESIFKILESKYNNGNELESDIRLKLQDAVLEGKSENELRELLEELNVK
jgi:hypothetical protein